MNQLFPIIRRKRRPLLPEDAPPMGNVEPPNVDAGGTQPNKADGANGTPDKALTNDEKVSTPE